MTAARRIAIAAVAAFLMLAVASSLSPATAQTGDGEGAEPGPAGTDDTGTDPTPDEQPSGRQVPCRVALVVGCIADDGTVAATLTPLAGASTAVINRAAAGGDGTGSDAGDGADSDRPVTSALDPWERGGLDSNFGTDSIPISHYQIGADVTGWLDVPDPLDSFVASQTNWAFTTTAFLVILGTNALEWAFEFPLAEDLVGDAGVLAQTYTVDFFGFGLSTSVYGLALSVTMLVAGFKAVTKGVIVAGSEVMLAFVAYVILIVLTVTSSFGDVGLRVANISSDLSSNIATFAAGQDRQQECSLQLRTDSVDLAGAEAATTEGTGGAATSGESSACTFGYALQRSLVELPYQNLQWGQVLDGVDGKERCAAMNLELLAEGPWGNADEPRDRMRAIPECEENADFNHQATYIRLGIASANTLSAAAVTLLVLVVCAMLLWQQVKLLALTVTLPHALVLAILPGRSRRLAWQWLEHLLGVIIRTVILAIGLVVWLSLYSLIVYEQLTFRGIFLSFFASVAMAVGGFYGLYRLGSLTRRLGPGTPGLLRGDGDDDRPPTDGERSTTTRRAATQVAHSTLRTVRHRSSGSRRPGPTVDEPPRVPAGAGSRR